MADTKAFKDFFKYISKDLTDVQWTRIQSALAKQRYGKDEDGEPREPTPDDAIDWMWRQLRDFANRETEREHTQQVEIPPEELLD